MDRSTVLGESRRDAREGSNGPQVDLCHDVLLGEEQSDGNVRGQPKVSSFRSLSSFGCKPVLTILLLHLSDLEQAVESLSELLERPLEEDKIAELRQQTTDKTVYVTKRCKVLLEDTIRGYDEVSWYKD